MMRWWLFSSCLTLTVCVVIGSVNAPGSIPSVQGCQSPRTIRCKSGHFPASHHSEQTAKICANPGSAETCRSPVYPHSDLNYARTKWLIRLDKSKRGARGRRALHTGLELVPIEN